jgi:hypothetical protein
MAESENLPDRWLTGGKSPGTAQTEAKSEIECLRSIDGSLATIRRIARWFMILSILGVLVGFMAATGAFR